MITLSIDFVREQSASASVPGEGSSTESAQPGSGLVYIAANCRSDGVRDYMAFVIILIQAPAPAWSLVLTAGGGAKTRTKDAFVTLAGQNIDGIRLKIRTPAYSTRADGSSRKHPAGRRRR
jgi:hypothetical protein